MDTRHSVGLIATFLLICACHSVGRLALAEPPQQPKQNQPANALPRNGSEAAHSANIAKAVADLRKRFASMSDDELAELLQCLADAESPADKRGMKWFSERLDRAMQQRKAVDAIIRLGGGIAYDYQKGSSICRLEGKPRAPEWLRQTLDDHFFVDVVGVSLSGAEVTNDELALLQAFPRLEFVMLRCPNVSETSLASLGKLRGLKYVEVRDSQVTREAMNRLAKTLPEHCAIDCNGEWIRRPQKGADRPSPK